MSNDDHAHVMLEAEVALREYELSRDRYLHTLRADAEAQLVKAVGVRREKLVREIENLHALAAMRAETRTAAVRAYAQRCPARVTATSMLPPGPAERVGGNGVDKLYKIAVKAAEEFNEVNDVLRKRRESLEEIDREMRDVLHKQNEELIRVLESPDGLATAFKRDPLLGLAHTRMKAAAASRDAALHGAGTPPEAAAS